MIVGAVMSHWICRLALGLLVAVVPAWAAEPPRAAVVAGLRPDAGRLALAQQLAELAQTAGYIAQSIDFASLTNAAELDPDRLDLLVLADGRALPAPAVEPIHNWLKTGGDLLALGLPLWDTPLLRLRDRWITRADYDATIAVQTPGQILEDFDVTDLSLWRRSSDKGDNPVHHELTASDRGQALHVVIDRFTGWETFGSPPLSNPFAPGHTLTCFRAKGGPNTPQLCLEWTENNGARWIAVVDLKPEWQSYTLPPEAFKAWTPPAGRGGPGDRLNFTNAAWFTVGIAYSHTAIGGSTAEYWLDDLGTAPNPFGDEAPPAAFEPPRIESLCPGYQFFPVTTRAVVRPSHEKAPLEPWEHQTDAARLQFAVEPQLLAIHPRPRGVGYKQDRPWRWEPLLGAYDPNDDDYRGALAALLVNVKTPYYGSVWAGFTPSNPEFYRQPLVTNALRQTLERLCRGAFLIEAGPEQFTVPEGSTADRSTPVVGAASRTRVRAGMRVANFGRSPLPNLSGAVGLLPASIESGSYERLVIELKPDIGGLACGETVTALPSGQQLSATLALLSGERLVDALVSPVRVWNPRFNGKFLSAATGSFQRSGQPWKVQGVNYLPSTGIGLANGQYFEHWLGRGAYDPSVVQRDLERIRNLGLNTVSAFIYYQSLDAGHLFDFLARCERLNLMVNLSLRPGTPMDFRWNEMKALIEHYQLASNRTVMAYDLAWEPSHYDEAYQRRRYTTDWTAWVQERYGSITNAEAHWALPIPNPQSAILNPRSSIPTPPMAWLTQDGPWRRVIADYRRFLDELVGTRYAEARRLVRSIDPNHLVSFRMQLAGDPTHNAPGLLPYDFKGLSEAVDIWEPEAYGRIGDWEKVKAGHFTAAYARLCNPELPVVWAEMGYDIWNPQRMMPSTEKLAFAARYYRDFFRMLRESGADGVIFWWYPGGYRLNERSDYGILNPDGTDREVSRVIREAGSRFLAAPKPPPPDVWIEVDRDHDARGLVGSYEAVRKEYWQAIETGRRPGLRWRNAP